MLCYGAVTCLIQVIIISHAETWPLPLTCFNFAVSISSQHLHFTIWRSFKNQLNFSGKHSIMLQLLGKDFINKFLLASIAFIQLNDTRWWSHVKRMAPAAPQTKALVIHPVGKWPRGRPRNRWEDDVVRIVRLRNDMKLIILKNDNSPKIIGITKISMVDEMHELARH